MDEQSCPRCKTTKYRNPLLKLMVNVCGHSLCESCVELLFVRGSANCPECGTALRKNNFRMQYFEDPTIEREMDIRKTVLKVYNRREEEFSTLREYNDYLEEVENIVFNLVNGIDVEETKNAMEQYKNSHSELIRKNKIKMSRDEQLIEELIELEKQQEDELRQQVLEEEFKNKSEKNRNREHLLHELTTSSQMASSIVASHKRQADAATASSAKNGSQQQQAFQSYSKPLVFSSGLKIGGTVSVDDHLLVAPAEPEPFVYEPLVLDMCGPPLPDVDLLSSSRYLQCVRKESASERAAGFRASLACERALHDAFAALYFTADNFLAGEQSFMDTS